MPTSTRRSRAGAAAFLIVPILVLSLTGCGNHYYPSAHPAAARPSSVAAQMAYITKYWKHHNTKAFGDLGGTDCMDFVSQALLARGWAMNKSWGHSGGNGTGNGYSPAWISSTAFANYMTAHPNLGTKLTWAQRSQVAVGDVVQFDYDDNGEPNHTATVSKVVVSNGVQVIYVAQHSASHLYWPILTLLSQNPKDTVVWFWHLT